MSKLYVVGDSTLSKFNDITYYYPRYGYATMLDKYYNIEIVNYALSGRSSKSYTLEREYDRLWTEIKKDDFLLIGFGHNDQKSDDHVRFTDARLDINDEKAFSYSLYNSYIKKALEIGAIPILATPIVRLDPSMRYEGLAIHDTLCGNYQTAIIKLAKDLKLFCVDLTSKTKEYMQEISYYEQCLQHAIVFGMYDGDKIIPNIKAVDKAHLSQYGAFMTAYFFMQELKKQDCLLNNYLYNEKAPTKLDIIVNSNYRLIKYESPKLNSYMPISSFRVQKKGFYGTAFGDTDKNPNLIENGFVAYEDNDKFIVGNKNNYGKIHASVDSMAMVFTQIDYNKNFIIKVNAKILSYTNTKQSALGLIIRDDCYINQDCDAMKIASNYVCAGAITTDASSYIIFSRSEPTDLNKGDFVIDELYKVNDTFEMEIERIGQRISVKTIYNGKLYEKSFFDFDLVATDARYIYPGIMASKGVVVEYSSLYFEITGDAKDA